MAVVKIVDYSPEYKHEFLDISMQWLKKYDLLEDMDFVILKNPEEIVRNGGHIFFAQYGGKVIGTVAMAVVDDDVCEILKYGVREEYQGLGAGRLLMERVIFTAREEGRKNLTLTSNHKLEKALKIYESFGFVYAPYEDTKYELSDVKMELELSGSC